MACTLLTNYLPPRVTFCPPRLATCISPYGREYREGRNRCRQKCNFHRSRVSIPTISHRRREVLIHPRRGPERVMLKGYQSTSVTRDSRDALVFFHANKLANPSMWSRWVCVALTSLRNISRTPKRGLSNDPAVWTYY